MPKIGQKTYAWLLQDQIIDGAGANTWETLNGSVNLKVWGVTADSDDIMVGGDFTPGPDQVLNGAFTAGADQVANGAFASDTGWIKGIGWTIAAGVAASDASQTVDSDIYHTPAVALIQGEVYELTFTTANRTAGNATGVVGGTEGTDRATNATFVEQIIAGAGATIAIRADADFDGDIDNVSLTLVGSGNLTLGTGWSVTGNKAVSDASQSGDSDLTQTPTTPALIPGEAYEVVFTVSDRTAGNVTAVVGDQEGTDRATNATFTEQIVCGAGADLDLRADLNFDGKVDTLSITRVADTGWTLGTGWTISGGLASSDASQGADADLTMTPTPALLVGEVFEVTFTVSNYVAGNVTAVVGGTEGTDRAANGTFVEEIIAGAGADLDFRGDLNFDGSIDDIAVVRKNLGWDGATVNFQVRAEDGITWITVASKTADAVFELDLGSSPNELCRAVIASADTQTKLSCTAAR